MGYWCHPASTGVIISGRGVEHWCYLTSTGVVISGEVGIGVIWPLRGGGGDDRKWRGGVKDGTWPLRRLWCVRN